MSENGRQRFFSNFTGILLLYPQGSVEFLDNSDDIENRVKLWIGVLKLCLCVFQGTIYKTFLFE